MVTSIKRYSIVVPLISTVVLAGCVSQSQYDVLQAQNQQLSAQLAYSNAQITRLQGAIQYAVNGDLLFSSGGWQISARGKRIIARLTPKLAPTLQNQIIVSGYTDNTPISPALQQKGIASNQDLSLKRAQSVMQYLISQGVNPNMISAHGFGKADPVASNATAQGRAKNRRVELSLAGS